MMTTNLPNIPRVYTALAEWLACGLLLLPIQHKPLWILRYLAFGAGQIALQLTVGTWSDTFWIPGMILNVLWMFATLWGCGQAPLTILGLAVAKAFVLAEFVASLAWELYCYLILGRVAHEAAWGTLFMLLVYVLLFAGDYWIEHRHATRNQEPVTRRALVSGLLTATIVFAVSNIGFILANTRYTIGDSVTIFIFRTFINLCGLLIFAIQDDQRQESALQSELGAINRMFQTQYDQYTAYKSSSAVIRRQFHDLKHQMAVILKEDNADLRAQYLADLNTAIDTYSATISTGNGVLDTILSQKNATCIANHIDMTCFADGKALDFMHAMDIASLFGNALDNAIESVGQLANPDKRLIEVRVSRRINLLVITFKNVFEGAAEFKDGLPKTTKKDTAVHGYGLKNIAYITHKYNGQMTISTQDGWFSLKIILPVPSDN
ncbi:MULTISPECIES: ATP-binding protein [unclassified Lacticaseibacillus]|uniref:ATP-binding protein n=1 Tax=unclassified Lacticaseibacillus TaxID=2759744 RepID=UPI0019449664|nr:MULTISPECIES: ATP-binding protein [unclassified Lacticaseibacillus]